MKTGIMILLGTLNLLAVNASELFIQMEQPSTYTITIADQTITNSNGKFRFFDLQAGFQKIYLFNGSTNDLLLTHSVTLGTNTRTVLYVTSMGTIIVKGTYQTITPDWYNSYLANNNAGNASLNRNFEDFIKELQDTHTEQRKLDMANDYIYNTYLTADHVAVILRTFDFDTYRVKFAINAYDKLTDPQNYFIWKDRFDFRNNYIKVETAIKAKR